jgi:hypothetical protein
MIIAIYRNDKGRKTFLHHDESGTYSAFVGKLGGDLRTWKTREHAEKALTAHGWQKIGERKEALEDAHNTIAERILGRMGGE